MIKKIGCLVLALIMVLAMTATSFARESTASDMDTANPIGVLGDFDSPDTIDSSIKESVILLKEITAYNL